jgi:hypothetical protein
MIGQGVARDIPLVSTDRLTDYGALTPYLPAVARPSTFFPMDAVPGPRPDASLLALQNIGNMPIRQVVAQLPPPQQEVWRQKLVSHFTVLPSGGAAQAPMGNA